MVSVAWLKKTADKSAAFLNCLKTFCKTFASGSDSSNAFY